MRKDNFIAFSHVFSVHCFYSGEILQGAASVSSTTFSPGSATKSTKRLRTAFTSWQLRELEYAFRMCPYPDSSLREQIASTTGIEETKIQVSTKLPAALYSKWRVVCAYIQFGLNVRLVIIHTFPSWIHRFGSRTDEHGIASVRNLCRNIAHIQHPPSHLAATTYLLPPSPNFLLGVWPLSSPTSLSTPSTPFPWPTATLHTPISLHPFHTSRKLPCCLMLLLEIEPRIQWRLNINNPKLGSQDHRARLYIAQV